MKVKKAIDAIRNRLRPAPDELDELVRLFKSELGIKLNRHHLQRGEFQLAKERVKRVANGDIKKIVNPGGWKGIAIADSKLDKAVYDIVNKAKMDAKINEADVEAFLKKLDEADDWLRDAEKQHRALNESYLLKVIDKPAIIDALKKEIELMRANPDLIVNAIYIIAKHGEITPETFRKSVGYLHYKKRRAKVKKDKWRK